jgi:glycine/D-amino acid oxidase-like deaminating enzyme
MPPVQNIVVTGGGIMGCSVALSLARRPPGVKVTVVDMLSDSEAGETTPASWAWLNATGKEPKSHQLLSQLGLHAWKYHPELSSLPSWMGSLVRFEKQPAFVDEGGYPVDGPLSKSKIHELEPLAHSGSSRDIV